MDLVSNPFVRATHVYAAALTKKGARELGVDICLPDTSTGPVPLVAWLHAGGFRTGSRLSPKHDLIARAFARHGYAVAFLDYRLARPAAILGRATRLSLPGLIADSEQHGEEMHETFRKERALAVVEDVCDFYDWIVPRQAEFGLDGVHILAGSSAGGISVLNTLMLHRVIRRRLPPIRSAFVLSGGFAYPSHWRDGDTRILALHNPADPKVAFSSIRRVQGMAQRNFTLLAEDGHGHGAVSLSRDEDLAAGVARLVAFDRDGRRIAPPSQECEPCASA
ncbi:MAG: alpha/beta hydrolase [Gemmobacter sp.]